MHILRTIFCGAAPPISGSACAITAISAIDLRLSILFENDFADLFEVRGAHRERRGTATAKLRGDDQVLLVYHGLDDKVRRTALDLRSAAGPARRPTPRSTSCISHPARCGRSFSP